MKNTKQKNLVVVIDLPNVLIRKKGINVNNFLALIDFLRNNRNILFWLIITPKLRITSQFVVQTLEKLSEKENNVFLFYSEKNFDPDEVILSLAQKFDAFIISNDRYRQEKYQKYNLTLKRLLKFKIVDNKLILIP